MTQNLDKEVVVKHEADLKFKTLQLKNKSLQQEIQDLRHAKETLTQQIALVKEHKVKIGILIIGREYYLLFLLLRKTKCWLLRNLLPPKKNL